MNKMSSDYIVTYITNDNRLQMNGAKDELAAEREAYNNVHVWKRASEAIVAEKKTGKILYHYKKEDF